MNDIFTIQCLKIFHNYINDRVPVFFGSFFVENALYHDYETRHCHHICIPHSHTTKARKCIRYHIPMLLNMLPLPITAKLYTHSQIGFVNYTKQLFLNGYTSTCLVENCYVCRCVETWCGIWGILSFFDNIGVTKLCVFCRSIIHVCSAVFHFFATFMLYKVAPIMFIL